MSTTNMRDLLREGWRHLPVNPQSTPTQLRLADLLQPNCEPGLLEPHRGRFDLRESAWRLPGAQSRS